MDAVQKVGNGHPGTAMSLAPAAYLLFQKLMRHNPADPHWPGRDRFVLSCGHSSLTLYIQLYLAGYGLELDDLKALRTWGSLTPGHPEHGHTAGVETTTGPLGQGVGNAVGMAMAARRERGLFDPKPAPGESIFDHDVFVLRQRRRPRGRRQRRGVLARRTPAARQPRRAVRRQPDLDRGRHRRRVQRGRRQALRGLRLARPDTSTGPTAARNTRRTSQALFTAFKAAKAETEAAELHPAPHDHRLAGADRAEHRQGARLGPRRGRGRRDQEDAGLRPRPHLRGARRGHRAHPPGHRPRQGRAGRVAGAIRRMGHQRRRAQGALRPDADPHAPGGWADALPTFERRREGHRDPRRLRRRADRDRAGAARALGRLGRPGRLEQHHPQGRAELRPTRARDQDVPRRLVRPGAALRHPRARDGLDPERHRPARRHPARTAARSWSSPTTCARQSAWPR